MGLRSWLRPGPVRLDTISVRGVLGALQGIAATAVESELTHEFGVAWIPRPDGRGNEIRGVTQEQMDAYSTRTVQVHAKERELARAWEAKHGRAPTSRELLHIANDATLQSRRGKDPGAVDWDALAQRWDATLGGELAGIAPAVSTVRGPDTQAGEHHSGWAPAGPPAREAQARALAKALTLVSAKHPAWTRHDLVKQIALAMPPEARQMNPQAAQELLVGLTEEALSGRTGQVVCLEAPEWPPLPASLHRQLDGRSIYTRPGAAQYATTAQLTLEEQLVAHAQARGAPRLAGEVAARRLGADLALLEAQLRGRPHDAREHASPRGLQLDQASAVWHVLTSPRTVEVITGLAGTGKTRVLATAASVWDGPVFGTATSQNATNELRAADVLGRDGAELSATQTRQRNLANADHLATLHAIWTAETTAARNDRYRDLVLTALPPSHRHQDLSGHARWLFRAVHAAELAGLDPPKSSPPPSPPATWPEPATSPPSSTPGSAPAPTRCRPSRKAPGLAASHR